MTGSSPRMRGALANFTDQGQPARIIPADAGSTRQSQTTSLRPWDHPRGCGEHLVSLTCKVTRIGSSPRMRGALWSPYCLAGRKGIIPADAGSLVAVGVHQQPARIIPADAGSTRWSVSAGDRHGDHPRGCGEHSPRRLPVLLVLGSSPRMRGAHRR